MKKTTCNNLGGACDELLTGESASEMGENSRNHVMQKIQAGDEAHKKALDEMMALILVATARHTSLQFAYA